MMGGMTDTLTYEERTPAAPLSTIASTLWYLRGPSPEQYEKILPLPFVHLIVNLGEPYTVIRRGDEQLDTVLRGAFISGIQSTYLVNENPRELHHVGVRLTPLGLYALTTENLADHVLEAESILPGIDDLRVEILADTPVRAMERMEAWLTARIRSDWRPSPLAAAALATIQERPSARMRDIAHALGTTPKTLIATVKRNSGLTPKRYADLFRHFEFVNAIPDQPPFPSWSDLIGRTGYYDQPHFIRTFARYTGMTPRQYLASKQHPGSTASFLSTPTAG